MKTQIIHLERHDTLISTQDKIAWAKGGRILLVWPDDGQILNRLYDLVFLQRYADSQGTRLGIVSRDGKVRRNASQLNISSFRTIQQAQRSTWKERSSLHRLDNLDRNFRDLRSERPDPVGSGITKRRNLNTVKIFFTCWVLLAVLAGVGLFLPRADLQMVPQTQIQEASITIHALPDTLEDLPAEAVTYQTRTVTVESVLSSPTSGSTVIPVEFAQGLARFTNQTRRAIQIPAGTVVYSSRHPEQKYETTRGGTLPGESGKSVDIPIRAALPGDSYNLTAGTIDSMEDLSTDNLTVTNPASITGGSGTKSPAPTVYDQTEVKENLLAVLEDQAWDQISSSLTSEGQTFRSGLVLEQILLEEYDVPAGSPADTITLTMQAEYSVPVIQATSLVSAVTEYLDSHLPDGFQPDGRDVKINEIDGFTINQEGSLSCLVTGERQIIQTVDKYSLFQSLLGVKVKDAATKMKAVLKLNEIPVVEVEPDWWPWMPLLTARINLQMASGD